MTGIINFHTKRVSIKYMRSIQYLDNQIFMVELKLSEVLPFIIFFFIKSLFVMAVPTVNKQPPVTKI